MQNSILDYQRIMLAEMGIPLWVSHATPVQTIDLAQFDQENFTQQNKLQSDFSQENFTEKKTPLTPILTPQLVPPTPVLVNKLVIPSRHDEFVQKPSESPIFEAENLLAISYSLACMRVNHWILLADNQHLSAHPAELQLWQSMAQGLNAEQKILTFPIVKTHPNQPTNSQMNDRHSAQMTFFGFIYAQVTNPETMRIGALSPLPELIEDTPLHRINLADIQRLPYLGEMLADPRQKRQLWELIKK